jgi:hypothetical protein
LDHSLFPARTDFTLQAQVRQTMAISARAVEAKSQVQGRSAGHEAGACHAVNSAYAVEIFVSGRDAISQNGCLFNGPALPISTTTHSQKNGYRSGHDQFHSRIKQ